MVRRTAKRPRRAAPRRATTRAGDSGRAAPVPAPYPLPGRLVEEPHAHMVCRRCGRIASVELTQLDLFELEILADRRPSGWTVDGVTYSVTGHCPRCAAAHPR